MKVKLFFAWYDFWVGAYFDRKTNTLYICLVPMVCVSIKKDNSKKEFTCSWCDLSGEDACYPMSEYGGVDDTDEPICIHCRREAIALS